MKNSIIIKKIITYIDKVQSYTEGIDKERFTESDMLHEACVFCLSQMGELVTHMDDDFKERHSDVPWRKISGMRHHIVHDYEGIIIERIWDTITDNLPDLKVKLEQIVTE